MSPTIGSVIIVDDDAELRSTLAAVLGDNEFLVTQAGTGREAQALIKEQQPDVILLDLGLPDVSGLDLLAELTAASTTPVIVVSGRSGETDAVVGLEIGADDYISKPFSERELVARVKAALRRSHRGQVLPTLASGSLVIDVATRDVMVDERRVDLTPKEFDVLAFLASSPRRVYSRQQLLHEVWESSAKWQDDNTVAEHIHRIRRKLDPDDRSKWIETVRGVGYRFAPPLD